MSDERIITLDDSNPDAVLVEVRRRMWESGSLRKPGDRLVVSRKRVNELAEFVEVIKNNKTPEDVEGAPPILPFSILIPAWGAAKFIDDSLASVERQNYFTDNNDFEVLVGVDGCAETLAAVKAAAGRYRNVRVLWFPKNVGAYVVRNTLVAAAKNDALIFHDADDMMRPFAVWRIRLAMLDSDYIRFDIQRYPGGLTVKNWWSGRIAPTGGQTTIAHGLFAITKERFAEFGGFMPWKCGADTEFHCRATSHGAVSKHIPMALVEVRKHVASLSMAPETGMGSDLRREYHRLGKEQTTKKIKPVTAEYQELTLAEQEPEAQPPVARTRQRLPAADPGIPENRPASVIVPAFNCVEFIGDAIWSLTRQDYWHEAAHEIIVGVDGCLDTLEAMRKLIDSRPGLRVVWFPDNAGAYIVRNTLICQYARHDDLILFDADDVACPDMAGRVMDGLRRAEIVRFYGRRFWGNAQRVGGLNIRSKVLAMGVFGMRRSVMEAQGGFMPWPCAADGEFLFRAERNGISTLKLDEELAHFRKHSGSLTNRADTDMKSELRAGYIAEARKERVGAITPVFARGYEIGGEVSHE